MDSIARIVKPVAVFRSRDTEGPGHFATFLDAHRVPWQLVKLDEGEPVPASERALRRPRFMGGPMSANDELPWTQPVLALMRDAVDARCRSSATAWAASCRARWAAR